MYRKFRNRRNAIAQLEPPRLFSIFKYSFVYKPNENIHKQQHKMRAKNVSKSKEEKNLNL